MVYIRIRFKKLGGHYHCRLFTSQRYDGTFASCGSLVFDEREIHEVQDKLSRCEWIADEESAAPQADNAGTRQQAESGSESAVPAPDRPVGKHYGHEPSWSKDCIRNLQEGTLKIDTVVWAADGVAVVAAEEYSKLQRELHEERLKHFAALDWLGDSRQELIKAVTLLLAADNRIPDKAWYRKVADFLLLYHNKRARTMPSKEQE
jgi:hypothetical protein